MEKPKLFKDKKVGVVLSGGNLDETLLKRILV